MPGIATWIEHLPGGIDLVILLNGSERRHAEHPEEAEQPTEALKGNALQDARKAAYDMLRTSENVAAGRFV